MFLVLQSANRDKGTSADPDRFDIERPVSLPKILDWLGDNQVSGEVTWQPTSRLGP